MLRCSVGWTQPASASQPCEAQRVCTSEAPAGSALATSALGLARTCESPDKAHRTIPVLGLIFPATSAPGLGPPLPHLHRDCAHPCHICTGTAPTPATSAPGLGPPLPHLHRDCTRTIRSIFGLVFPAMTGIMAGACVRQLARNPKGTLPLRRPSAPALPRARWRHTDPHARKHARGRTLAHARPQKP